MLFGNLNCGWAHGFWYLGILGFKDLIDVIRTWMMFCTNFGELLCQGSV